MCQLIFNTSNYLWFLCWFYNANTSLSGQPGHPGSAMGLAFANWLKKCFSTIILHSLLALNSSQHFVSLFLMHTFAIYKFFKIIKLFFIKTHSFDPLIAKQCFWNIKILCVFIFKFLFTIVLWKLYISHVDFKAFNSHYICTISFVQSRYLTNHLVHQKGLWIKPQCLGVLYQGYIFFQINMTVKIAKLIWKLREAPGLKVDIGKHFFCRWGGGCP